MFEKSRKKEIFLHKEMGWVLSFCGTPFLIAQKRFDFKMNDHTNANKDTQMYEKIGLQANPG